MKRNGRGSFSVLKQWITSTEKVDVPKVNNYGYGLAKTPPMGWSSKVAFADMVDSTLIMQTAETLVQKGLLDLGYNYINIDEGWQSKDRDITGKITADINRFPQGMSTLVKDVNDLGLKVGIHLSCGYDHVNNINGSRLHQKDDANTIVNYGAELLNYQLRNQNYFPMYASLISGISIEKVCADKHATDIDIASVKTQINLADGELSGNAKLETDKANINLNYVTGLDKCAGSFSIKYNADLSGEYVVNLSIKATAGIEKMLVIAVDENTYSIVTEPVHDKDITIWELSAKIKLAKGENKLYFINPIADKEDSTKLFFDNMARCLQSACEDRASAVQSDIKPITYFINECGRSDQYLWAKDISNAWQNTDNISSKWSAIKRVYNYNVKLNNYASVDRWNNPDVMQVGNGKLTLAQNKSHFSLWCMMNAPLFISADIRYLQDAVLDVLSNKEMIAVNQDKLGKQAKLVRKGTVDLIAKPLYGGAVAVCIFNKSAVKAFYNFSMETLVKDEYVNLSRSSSYSIRDVWSGRDQTIGKSLCGSIDKDSVIVYIVSSKN